MMQSHFLQAHFGAFTKTLKDASIQKISAVSQRVIEKQGTIQGFYDYFDEIKKILPSRDVEQLKMELKPLRLTLLEPHISEANKALSLLRHSKTIRDFHLYFKDLALSKKLRQVDVDYVESQLQLVRVYYLHKIEDQTIKIYRSFFGDAKEVSDRIDEAGDFLASFFFDISASEKRILNFDRINEAREDLLYQYVVVDALYLLSDDSASIKDVLDFFDELKKSGLDYDDRKYVENEILKDTPETNSSLRIEKTNALLKNRFIEI